MRKSGGRNNFRSLGIVAPLPSTSTQRIFDFLYTALIVDV